MRKIVAMSLILLGLSGCGLLPSGSSAKATGPSAPIMVVCAEDQSSAGTSSSNTTVTNNCDKSTKPVVLGEPVEE